MYLVHVCGTTQTCVSLLLSFRWTACHESLRSLQANETGLTVLVAERILKEQKNKLKPTGIPDTIVDNALDQNGAPMDSVSDFDWLIARKVEEVLRTAHAVSDMLEGDSYGTLGLVLPFLVMLDQDLTYKLEVFKNEHENATTPISQEALTGAISFVSYLQNELNTRLDPYTLTETNHVYLVASLLHPCFCNFDFFGGQQDAALNSAREFLHNDLVEMKGSSFTPAWMTAAFLRLHPRSNGTPNWDEDLATNSITTMPYSYYKVQIVQTTKLTQQLTNKHVE